tara:strand:- start:322 stop:627 length:306 start_codon:yes stop_codon:yes gene_type:complete
MSTKKFNIKEWKDTFNEGLPYDAFDKKPTKKIKKIDAKDLSSPLEYAMAWEGFDDLDDITTIKQFNDLIKAMKKTREVPAKFFDLKAEDQMGLVSQAIMYI